MKILNHRLHQDDGTPFPFERSPNQGGEVEHELLVMHYTAGRSAGSSVAWLTNPASRASAHLVIGRDGSITQLVAFNRVAWHAGVSSWLARSGVNQFSLGIELDNAGALTRHDGRWRAWFGQEYEPPEVIEAVHKHQTEPKGWHLFTEPQLEAAVEVAALLVGRYGLREVVGHEDVAPHRKEDPGPVFPLSSFRSKVLGRQENEPEVHETTTSLNIRQGPGTEFATLPRSPLPPGTRVEILEAQERWRFVEVLAPAGEAADLQGWVHGGFLRRVEGGDG